MVTVKMGSCCSRVSDFRDAYEYVERVEPVEVHYTPGPNGTQGVYSIVPIRTYGT